jgi:hypothetical protein
MARDGFKSGAYKAPEESSEGKRPPRGGKALREEGGFSDGEFGRGSTPYSRRHSGKHANGQPLSAHTATSGRGGGGAIGKGDAFKAHSEDLEHPGTHAEFEAMGGVDGGAGGNA